MLLFERDSVPGKESFIEGESRFRTVPFDEFSDRMVVGPLRTGRSKAVQYGRLGLLKIRKVKHGLRRSFTFYLALCHRNGLHRRGK